MPRTFSPLCKPVTAADVHSFCGVALLKEISLFVSVTASTEPTACVGAVVVDAARDAAQRLTAVQSGDRSDRRRGWRAR